MAIENSNEAKPCFVGRNGEHCPYSPFELNDDIATNKTIVAPSGLGMSFMASPSFIKKCINEGGAYYLFDKGNTKAEDKTLRESLRSMRGLEMRPDFDPNPFTAAVKDWSNARWRIPMKNP